MLLKSEFCIYFGLIFITVVFGEENCEKTGHFIYDDLGCTPNTNGKKCPISYNCNFEKKNNTCLFRNHFYNTNESPERELLSGSCQIGCFCGREGRFSCAIVECAEYWDIPHLEEGCYRTYSPDNCCSNGTNCPGEGSEIATCIVDGKTYREGENFFPRNSCYKCNCGKGFKGKLEEPYCKKINCANQLKFGPEYQRKCAPYYRKNEDRDVLCCPSNWICPQSTDEIVELDEAVSSKSDLTCKYGEKSVKFGSGFTRTSGRTSVRCKCSIPPLLTCTDV